MDGKRLIGLVSGAHLDQSIPVTGSKLEDANEMRQSCSSRQQASATLTGAEQAQSCNGGGAEIQLGEIISPID